MTIKLSKAGYPEEVFLLKSSDICRGDYDVGINNILLGIENFNDEGSRDRGLNFDFLARLYNTMLSKMGYDVPKNHQLTKEESQSNK